MHRVQLKSNQVKVSNIYDVKTTNFMLIMEMSLGVYDRYSR